MRKLAQFELQLKALPGKATFNYEEAKAWVESIAKHYNYVVTPENERTAKAERAEINRIIKQINEQRIQAKKDYMADWEPKEAQVMEITSMLKKTISVIDVQLKAGEVKRKEDKRKEIEEYFSSLDVDIVKLEIIRLDDVFNDKWLNKTVSTAKWQAELDNKIESIQSDLELIEKLQGDKEDIKETKLFYLDSLNINQALREFENKKEYKERLRKQEEEAKERLQKKIEAKKRYEQQLEEERQQAQTSVKNVTIEEMLSVENVSNEVSIDDKNVVEESVNAVVELVKEEVSNNKPQQKLQRIVVEFICNEEFKSTMNDLILSQAALGNVQTKILEREDI